MIKIADQRTSRNYRTFFSQLIRRHAYDTKIRVGAQKIVTIALIKPKRHRQTAASFPFVKYA